ncbi:MAG: hypothetical protein KDC53_22655 [Saprospiraceae bacterium]|nr:hypothetical protein [Saprospiraceae bacterium]
MITRLLIVVSVAVIISCQQGYRDIPEEEAAYNLSIRLGFEPDRINPILSRQVHASQIEGMIFLPLSDYNPFSLRLEPVLIKDYPKITAIDPADEEKGLRYEMEIMEEATWDDGTPVTGYDYLFTMKVAQDPYLLNTTWKNQMAHITDVTVDPNNPKKITVLTNNKYILSEEVITNNDVYPEHIYDPDQLLKPYNFQQIKNIGSQADADLDSTLHQFATQFNDEKYSREIISGNGPYEFEEWIPKQQIILKRKENWWGTKFQDKHPSLQAHPASITYHLIPDAQTALTSLKDQRLDLVADITPEQFQELKNYNNQEHPLTLEAPDVLSYYFIAYNNDRPALRDKRVRRAISMLMDIENLIDKLFYGLATRTIGPLSPNHPAYNHDVKPVPFDPQGALKLLAEAGWSDTNHDGILDKTIEGIKTNLSLSILTSRSQLSQDVAIILKSEAEKVGIQMSIIPNDVPKLIQDTENGDYDLSCLASVQSIAAYDPTNFWHSEKAGPGGTNYFNFRNAEVDSLIDKIRITLNESERNELYLKFQQILQDEQPALFLVAPKTPLAALKKLNFKTTTLRPGYFENTISIKN